MAGKCSHVGYDPNTMFSAAYDWRLSYINLEIRGIIIRSFVY